MVARLYTSVIGVILHDMADVTAERKNASESRRRQSEKVDDVIIVGVGTNPRRLYS